MKKVRCELCESLNVVKENDVFVCKECGAKYTLEQAKKLLVEVEGDNHDTELENLYILARRAVSDSDFSFAAESYSKILLKCPNDWEAVFYQAYCSGINCKIMEIGIKNTKLKGAVESAVDLAIENLKPDELINALNKIVLNAGSYAISSFESAIEWYNGASYSVRSNFTQSMLSYSFPCVQVLYTIAEKTYAFIEKDNTLKKNVLNCLKRGVESHIRILSNFAENSDHMAKIYEYLKIIRKYEPYYKTNNKKFDTYDNVSDLAKESELNELKKLKNCAMIFAFCLPLFGIIFSLKGLSRTANNPNLAEERKGFIVSLVTSIIAPIAIVLCIKIFTL